MKRALLFAVTTALLLAAGPARLNAAEAVSIQLNWVPEPEFGGIYAAEAEGLFAAAGLDVTILKGGADVPAPQMTAAGRVDLGIAAADEVITLRERGADLVALFATYQTSPQGIMVRANRDVADIPALLADGGTLIAQPGLAYLKFLRQRFGMDSMKIVPYGSGGMAQLLDARNKKVAMQCFVFAEPIAARRQGIEPRVFLIADTGFDPYAAVIVTSGRYLREHREVCQRFVAAVREGWRRYLNDPDPANRVMASLNTAMDPETFAAAAAAQRPHLDPPAGMALGSMSLARWQTLAKQLLELGIISRPIAPEECFVNLPPPAP